MSHAFGKTGRSAVFLMFTAGVACAFAVLIGLGSWQVQRLHWKQDLIASISKRIASEPAAIADIESRLEATGDIDYWPVTISGTFEHGHERHFFATHKGASGYYVYTPMRLADGRILFANRGFVPFDLKDAAARTEGQITGVVSVSGLARNRLEEKPSWVVPDNDAAGNIYYWKDLELMARKSGYDMQTVLPFFVDADAAPNPGGLPIGGVTIIVLPNNHLQYAFTWYGLAAALAGVFGVWLWRARSATTT